MSQPPPLHPPWSPPLGGTKGGVGEKKGGPRKSPPNYRGTLMSFPPMLGVRGLDKTYDAVSSASGVVVSNNKQPTTNNQQQPNYQTKTKPWLKSEITTPSRTPINSSLPSGESCQISVELSSLEVPRV